MQVYKKQTYNKYPNWGLNINKVPNNSKMYTTYVDRNGTEQKPVQVILITIQTKINFSRLNH